MEPWQRLLKSFHRGLVLPLEFLYEICPHTDTENVSSICESIPAECEVDFIKLVTYQSGVGRICNVHSEDGDYEIDDNFRAGLEAFRNYYFAKYGPIQFGDHLYLKMRELRKVLSARETIAENKSTRSVPLNFERQLELIGELMVAYPPVALVNHIGA
jgi:hypothetical protein